MRLTDEGGDKRRRTSQGLPLIRPSVRTGAPSPHSGEGFGPAQIGRNSALCGTFGYIYWKLRRSAPVGGRAARMCCPYRRGGGNLPPHPPQCAHWGTCPYPLCPFGTSPLDKGSRPPVGGRLWACSNREGFCLLWDVLIHILGIRVEYACLVGGRVWGLPLREPSKSGGGKSPPYGFPETVLKLGRGALVLPPETCAREASGRVRAPAPTAYLRMALHIERGTGLEPVP